MIGNIGPLEIGLVLLSRLRAKRLPELGRGMGRGLREFGDSIGGREEEKEEPRSLGTD
jgi:Sec-independent protein translocase protein TatA